MSAHLESDIQRGFAAFMQASQSLERSYAALQQKAQAIDLQLARTNRDLKDSLAEREAILQALPLGVLARSTDGSIIWCNPEGERLHEAARKAGCDLLNGGDQLIETANLSLRVRHVSMAAGGGLLLIEDRSRVVHLEREVHRLDRLAGLSELALGVAHEIKNPLNGVMGFGALMERTEDPQRLRAFAAKMVAGLGQVDAIVKELLAFARPATVAVRRSSLQEVVREAATAAGTPVSWIRIVAGAEERVEAASLVRVLCNLFRNSVEASASSVQITIEASRVQNGSELQIIVADNGPGIAKEMAGRVFQPFVSTKDRGHGLGLALACRVLGFLNGSIELLPSSAGARFRIAVPVEPTLQEVECER